MSTYDDPIHVTYEILAGSLIAAADLRSIAGPKGERGSVVSIVAVLTTGVTVADSSVVVGDGTTANKYGSLPTPIAAANAVNNDAVTTLDANLIAANSRVVIGSGGGATAGAANIYVTIAWF